jgi:alpha-1,6-mannosyltransferase
VKFCDLTMAYNAKSGGIKTYIEEKRRFLRNDTDHHHLLIIPGKRDRVRRAGRTTTVTVRGYLLPGQDCYRVFLSPVKIRDVLLEEAPDVVELGSYYTEPWAAFSYRRRRRAAGAPCKVGAYFHTDVANAYVAAPLRALAPPWLGELSEALANSVETIADIAGSGAEKYMRYVFALCDVAMAASQTQAQRLRDYGVDQVSVVPMGVDLNTFHPRRRSAALRRQLGAGEGDLVLVYAGRLSREKRVLTLIDAFERLPGELRAQLWLIGDGPLRDEAAAAAAAHSSIKLLAYEADRNRFAAMLASADAYLTAGPFETFALSTVEAQACGLPTIGVAAGALRERVPDGLGLLGPVDDADAMARNIIAVLSARSEISQRARAHAERNFNWRDAFDRLLQCYGGENNRDLCSETAGNVSAGAGPGNKARLGAPQGPD